MKFDLTNDQGITLNIEVVLDNADNLFLTINQQEKNGKKRKWQAVLREEKAKEKAKNKIEKDLKKMGFDEELLKKAETF